MSRKSKAMTKVEMFDVFLDLNKCGLGMSIKGGIENDCNDIYISHIDPRGAVCEDGRIQLGDVLTAVNKHSLFRVTQKQAEDHVKKAIPYVQFTVRRTLQPEVEDDDEDDSETENEPLILDGDCDNADNDLYEWPQTSTSGSDEYNSYSGLIQVTLTRGPTGFGFTLTGGSDNQVRFNDPCLYITGMVDQSPAHLSGQIDRGDRIVAVNRQNLECVSYQKALDIIRMAPDRTTFAIRKNISWD